MSPLAKIIFTAVFSGFLSALIFALSAGFGLYLVGRNLEIAFLVSARPLTPFDGLLILLCLALVLTSLGVCPYVAYRIRDAIFAFANTKTDRYMLFGVVGSAQIIFLVLAYGLVLPSVLKATSKPTEPPSPLILRQQEGEKFNRELQQAEVKIFCQNARIINNYRDSLTAEITLRIENVPKIVSEYELQIRAVNEGKSFRLGSLTKYASGGHSIVQRPLNIKAERDKKNGWIFYQEYPQKTVVGTGETLTFRLDFYREDAPDAPLFPATVTPELKVRPKPDQDFFKQQIFFNRPVPIEFIP